jgi:hypothetical protein
MIDQSGARSLPTHRTTKTQNKLTYTSMLLSGIGTHDRGVRASIDSSCLRQRGHCDQNNRAIAEYVNLTKRSYLERQYICS